MGEDVNVHDPTVSDGATFEEMVEKAAKYARLHTAWSEPHRVPAHIRTALIGAGVPDLLVALRAKDAENEEARREIARLGQYEHESYGLTADVQMLWAELRLGADYMEDFIRNHEDPGTGPMAWTARNAALSEPAVEARPSKLEVAAREVVEQAWSDGDGHSMKIDGNAFDHLATALADARTPAVEAEPVLGICTGPGAGVKEPHTKCSTCVGWRPAATPVTEADES
jgi:hypothetical protein